MVDPHDSKTVDLLRLDRELHRDVLLDYMDEMRRCHEHGLWVARYFMAQQVRNQLVCLGGLASPW